MEESFGDLKKGQKTCHRTVPCQYFAPQKIEKALEILARYGKEIKVIAGGTDLLIQYYDRLYEVNGWLDLKNIEKLKEIKIRQNQMEIGAMVTHTQLEKSGDIQKYFPVLSKAAADIGSPQIRNRGTIGGNIVNASPAGDLLAPLIAYDAQFRLFSKQGEKMVPAEEFFIGPKKTILKSAQLLTQIILPLPSGMTYSSWIKIGKRKALIIATITLALVVEMAENNKTVKDAKACLGSVAPTPIEIKEIRKKMVKKNFAQLNFDELGQIVEDKISPIDDIRGTREYRKDVAKNIMINALEEIDSARRSELTINGKRRKMETTPSTRLLDLLRDDLHLTGTKEGCGKGECGACTVIMNGELIASCLVLAPQADGAVITTIEGIGNGENLDPIQEAFIETGAVQCGFCTPGMILATKKLLEENTHPREEEIKRGISGNLCRCTGYQKIIDAIKLSAVRLVEGNSGKGEEDE